MIRRALLLIAAIAGGLILFTAAPVGACGDGVARPECPTTTTKPVTTPTTRPTPTTTSTVPVVQPCVKDDGTRYGYNGGCYPTTTSTVAAVVTTTTLGKPQLAQTGSGTGVLALLAVTLLGSGVLAVHSTRRRADA